MAIEGVYTKLQGMERVGNTSMMVLEGNHHTMTSGPFLEVGTWEWLMGQKREVENVITTSMSQTQTTTIAPIKVVSTTSSVVSSTTTSMTVVSVAQTGGGRRMKILWWL